MLKNNKIFISLITLCFLTSCNTSPIKEEGKLNLITSGSKTSFNIGEEFSSSGLEVQYQVGKTYTKLESNEYSIDSSQYNKDVEGFYPIIVTYNVNNSLKAHYNVFVGPIKVTGISLSTNVWDDAQVGDDKIISATIYPDNATDKSVAWSSTNEDVVSVDGGKLHANKIGNSTIIATSFDGGYTAQCEVNVTDEYVFLKGISFKKEKTSIIENNSWPLEVTYNPSNATNKNVSFVSLDEDICTVDMYGRVTAHHIGESSIIATSEEGGYKATCKIIVTGTYIHVEEVILSKNSLSLDINETATIEASVLPENATNSNINWSTDKFDVIAVKEGHITALRGGKATLIASSEDNGIIGTCIVIVNDSFVPVSSISLDKTAVNLVKSSSITLNAAILPSNATDKTISWFSSDDSIAQVDSKGTVLANGVGSCSIFAISSDPSIKAECIIAVSPSFVPVESINFDKSEIDIEIGNCISLKAEVLPYNATDKTLTWKAASNIVSISNISENEIDIAALDEGNTLIVATSSKGGVTATIEINVSKTEEVVPDFVIENATVSNSHNLEDNVYYSFVTSPSVKVNWYCSNSYIATINSIGNLIYYSSSHGGSLTIIAVSAIDPTKKAEFDVEIGGFQYLKEDKLSEGIVEIKEGIEPTEINIPSRYYDNANKLFVPITTIPNNAFNNSEIETVNIPNSILSIHADAFLNCPNLIYTCSLGGAYLGNNFNHFFALIKFDIGDKKTISIHDGCKILASVAENSGSNTVEYINVPSSLTFIGDNAFKNFTHLKNLNFTSNVNSKITYIGSYAFYNDTNFVGFSWKNVPNLLSVGDYAFYSTICQNLEFPSTQISFIGERAFDNITCTSTTCYLPSNISYIGDGAFANIPSLCRFFMIGTSKNYRIIDDALYRCDSSTGDPIDLINYPSSKLNDSYIVPSSLKKIGMFAFSQNKNIERVTLFTSSTHNIKEIGESAFSYCESLEEVLISTNLDILGKRAFSFNHNLKRVQFMEHETCKINTIPTECFLGSTISSKLFLPKSILKIELNGIYLSNGGENLLELSFNIGSSSWNIYKKGGLIGTVLIDDISFDGRINAAKKLCFLADVIIERS